ncbi:bestrophin family ion channel [Nemorincola caseinilytica]|uniref:Bestrophin family ion channel n=1 Tax=Nemorincola caseinilytica TaxID=2054315 RepID=A0ABP8NA08_9BACT
MLLKEKIPFHYTFGKIKYEVMGVLAYSILVWIMYHNFHFVRIAIPLSVPAMLGTVISLLLGFRSNQAYDRWWEARHIWGAVVNDSRTVARQMLCFLDKEYKDEAIEQFRNRFVNRQIAWTYSLGQHLRGRNALQGLEKWLDKSDMDYLAGYTNKPAAMLNLHARDITIAMREGWLNRYQQVELDRTLSRLCDSQGKAERIKNTVFPSTYSLYIHFSLLLFIGLLPFGLIDFFGWAEILVVTAISACFLLIEKMAIHLQDPFDNKPTDTPVTTIAGNIERDLKQMIREPLMADVTMAIREKETFFVM